MFSRKSADVAPRTRASTLAAVQRGGAATFSVFGPDVTITGDVSASVDLHVDGRIEGDVTCASLVQGESSEIAGAIRASSARLAGTVRGSIEAAHCVILATARIHGDVIYDALTIEQGAQVDGRFAHRDPAGEPLPFTGELDEDLAERISLTG